MRQGMIVFGIFLCGGLFGAFVFWYAHEEQNISNSKPVRSIGKFEFINPLLECEVAEGTVDARKENFHAELERRIAELKKERGLSDIGVYFRDLNNGPSFGVNENDGFFPASLLKVPVMMVYFHGAEANPDLLDVELRYEEAKDIGITPTIIPKEEMELGKLYTVGELIRRMIVYSDNQALFLLSSHLPEKALTDLFAILGVSDDVIQNSDGKLSVKEYASFFRILFNSSYLSHEYSEKALKLLSMTAYNDALPGKLSKDIKVSHKFGEAGTGDVDRQLHDCGIVYFPNHPYLACVMTRGEKTEDLKATIADISEFIYKKIDEQY